ncbi:MAG: GFA family protein [Inquilinus sp.]|uniref:GFA family protein n=1 Tax=Inquilinus sp. TaxID=1932117 RepID=UPI003F387174
MSDYPVLRPEPRADVGGERLRQGGCSCGAVRFTLRGEPLVVGICHCTECRKATGAVAMAYADWARDAFTTTGEVRTHRGRSFCPACGSRVFHLAERDGTVEILLGALDEAPGDLRPTREGWIIRREPWLAPIAGAGQFDRDPA